MASGPKLAQIASLIGDPARANMLGALMDGRALTASELAYLAGVSPQTASSHLSKLSDAGLLILEKQGRHRYFCLASAPVGRMLEGIMVVAQDDPAGRRDAWRGGEALRKARTCYDHMAGRIAVGIADSLIRRKHIEIDGDGGRITKKGHVFFEERGIAISSASRRRVFCRPCLDWSERRPHLAGVIGAALLNHAITRDWVQRTKDSRALTVTPAGTKEISGIFGVDCDAAS